MFVHEFAMLWHRVKKMMDDFKLSIGWDERHFIGVHIRRTDLAITQPDVSPFKVHSPYRPQQIYGAFKGYRGVQLKRA